jgi:hypothetical protein
MIALIGEKIEKNELGGNINIVKTRENTIK